MPIESDDRLISIAETREVDEYLKSEGIEDTGITRNYLNVLISGFSDEDLVRREDLKIYFSWKIERLVG